MLPSFDELHRLSAALLHLQHVIVARLQRLLGRQVRVLELVPRFLQVNLSLLKLADISGGNIVAAHLY